MYRKQVRRRRAILFALVALSLTLLSVYFGEGSNGPLHRIQRVVAAGLGPFEEVGDRALKPARDLFNWFEETFEARGENESLREEVNQLRDELADAQTRLSQGEELGKLSQFAGGGLVPPGYKAVTARVIGRSPSVWYSTVNIDKGSSSGLTVDTPVVAPDGLAGRISQLTAGTAQVTLITDSTSAVAGRVLPEGSVGSVEPTVGDPGKLALNLIPRRNRIRQGQLVVTAGFSTGSLSSLFPAGIPIGRVSDASVEEQRAFQRVAIKPFADLREMQFVQALVRTGG